MQVGDSRPKDVSTWISTPRPQRASTLPPTCSQTRAHRPHMMHCLSSSPGKRFKSAP